jgi:uncharacterized membrane protein YhfC
MAFITLFAITGFSLMWLALFIGKYLKNKWQMPKWLFLKAGLVFFIIQLFHLSVLDGAIGYFKDFSGYNVFLQAILFGVFTGLFFELGRFFVLDKLFKNVRDSKTAIYFATGWNGVTTFLIGLGLIVAAFGMYLLYMNEDISVLAPDAPAAQVQQLEEIRAEYFGPDAKLYMAIMPLVERVSLLLTDVFLTLLIVFALMSNLLRYVWGAVFLRALMVALIFIMSSGNLLAADLIYAAFGILSFIGIKKILPQMKY